MKIFARSTSSLPESSKRSHTTTLGDRRTRVRSRWTTSRRLRISLPRMRNPLQTVMHCRRRRAGRPRYCRGVYEARREPRRCSAATDTCQNLKDSSFCACGVFLEKNIPLSAVPLPTCTQSGDRSGVTLVLRHPHSLPVPKRELQQAFSWKSDSLRIYPF